MTHTNDTAVWTSGKKTALVIVLGAWFGVAAFIGLGNLLPNTSGGILAPIALSAIVPVVIFVTAYLASGGFRRFVLAQDIETLTMLQHWRVLGFAFLPLYFYGVLPGVFAFPAGLGDVAIGLAAPLIILRLRRDPDFATSAGFVRYQYLGLLDFAAAVGTAGLAAGAYPALISDGVTSAPMEVWPLNLFPSFAVPVFIILHLTVLLKVRALRRQSSALQSGALQAA